MATAARNLDDSYSIVLARSEVDRKQSYNCPINFTLRKFDRDPFFFLEKINLCFNLYFLSIKLKVMEEIALISTINYNNNLQFFFFAFWPFFSFSY